MEGKSELSSQPIHIVDGDSRRRAQVAFALSRGTFRPHVYESIEEFESFRPTSGLVLLNGDDDTCYLSELYGSLSARGAYVPIAMYSSKPDLVKVVEAMLSGALDYLQWPLDPSDMEAAIGRIADRSAQAARLERKRAAAQKLVAGLSGREREVLARLIDGQGNKTMADDLGISPRTIEVHRSNALRKLNVATSAEAVRIGLYAGLDQD
jgi:two-component system, LuxR family, response regulator FixJ